MVTPGVKRGGGGARRGSPRGGQRGARRALAVDRSSVRYPSVRPDDTEARAAMKAVAAERRRFGYREDLFGPS